MNKHLKQRNSRALYFQSNSTGNGCWFTLSIFILVLAIPLLIGVDNFIFLIEHIFKNIWTVILFILLVIFLPVIVFIAYYIFKNAMTSHLSPTRKLGICLLIFGFFALLTFLICTIYG